MCDDKTVADNEAYLADQQQQKKYGVTRRGFSTMTLGAAAMAMLPRVANAAAITEVDVAVPTPDGEADAYFAYPTGKRSPAVIVWPDVLGLRPAFRAMGKRLAQSGYAVLVINPYYRRVKAPVIEEGASFQDPATRAIVIPHARSLSQTTNAVDARAFTAFLDAQPSVDPSKQIGTMGYCMGGPMTLITAATIPDRIGAAASFHGGRLVTDSEESPHLKIPQMQASFLIAIASNDHEKEPETKDVLREHFAAANLSAEIEVYADALHGWCPPDSRVYNEAQAEHAWARLLHLFSGALV